MKQMKTTISITIDTEVLKDLKDDVGKGNVSGWIEDQAKKNHESVEMEKKVNPRSTEGNISMHNNSYKPLLIIGAKQTTLDIFSDSVSSITNHVAGIDDLPTLRKLMKNSKVISDVARTKIRKAGLNGR